MKKYLFLIAAATFALYACGQKEPDATPDVSVDPTELTASAEGGSMELNITSNTDWAVNASANWLAVEPTKGSGNAKVTVTIAENTSSKERNDKITISCAAKRATVTVKQEGAAVVIPDVKITEIKSAEDFAAFGAAAEVYEPTDVVKLEADITISEPIDSVVCIFDGQDKTITINYEDKEGYTSENKECAHIGVIRVVAGTVKNLKVAGSITSSSIANESTFHIGGVAGIVRSSGTIENCESAVTLLATTGNTQHMGGIAGYTAAGVSISNCKNTGSITMTVEGTAKGSQLGGIIGHLEGSGTVTSCTNEGDISYTGAATCRMGGITGYVNNVVSVTFKSCSNSGTLANDATGYGDTKWSYQGGIAGYYGTPTAGSTILYEDCSNSGSISTNAAGSKLRVRIGGIAAILGNAEATTEYKNCSNSGTLTLTNGSAGRSHLGGILGYAEKAGTFIMTNCSNSGSISADGKGTVKTDGIGGILGSGGTASSSFTNVTVDPSVKLTTVEGGVARLIAVGDVAYDTPVTGKVAGTITVGEVTTEISADNFASWLFNVDLGTGGNTSGVTFGK